MTERSQAVGRSYRVRRDYGSAIHLARDRVGGCVASGMILVGLAVLVAGGRPISDPLVLLLSVLGLAVWVWTLRWKDEVMLDFHSGVLRERRGSPPPPWREFPLGSVEVVERLIVEVPDFEASGMMTHHHHVMVHFRDDAHPPISVWFPLGEGRASRFHHRLAASLNVEPVGPTEIEYTSA